MTTYQDKWLVRWIIGHYSTGNFFTFGEVTRTNTGFKFKAYTDIETQQFLAARSDSWLKSLRQHVIKRVKNWDAKYVSSYDEDTFIELEYK